MNELYDAIGRYKFLIEYWIKKDKTKIAKPLKELSLKLEECIPIKELVIMRSKLLKPNSSREGASVVNKPNRVIKNSRLIDIPNWQKIRKQILKRDEEKCRMCSKEYYLHVHHIDYDRLNNNESNLVTLCEPCHRAIHKEGYKPWNDDYPAPWDKKEIDEYNQENRM